MPHNLRHKPFIWICGMLLPALVWGQVGPPRSAAALRSQLLQLLQEGQVVEAVQLAQQALQAAGPDPAIRGEVVELHLSLAAVWLEDGRIGDARAACQAALRLDAGHPGAAALSARLERLARRDAELADPRQLLRFELFDAALDALQSAAAAPLADSVSPTGASAEGIQADAWLGAADEHYRCGNFSEAVALYEQYLALAFAIDPAVRLRWGISLALALSQLDAAALTPTLCDDLQERALNLPRTAEARGLAQLIFGYLDEARGRGTEAGRRYADALGEAWSTPPFEETRARLAAIRQRATQQAAALFDRTPAARVRCGTTRTATTARVVGKFGQVQADDAALAQLVSDALDFHLPRQSAWLGLATPGNAAFCSIRVHAEISTLRTLAGAEGVSSLVRVLRPIGQPVRRELELAADDPWLLSASLPRELVGLLLDELDPAGRLPPFARVGIALQAEAPARRLKLRRALGVNGATFAELTRAGAAPTHAEADALTRFLLASLPLPNGDGSPTFAALRDAFPARNSDTLGPLIWTEPGQLEQAWSRWRAARAAPARMPLMIRAQHSGPRK